MNAKTDYIIVEATLDDEVVLHKKVSHIEAINCETGEKICLDDFVHLRTAENLRDCGQLEVFADVFYEFACEMSEYGYLDVVTVTIIDGDTDNFVTTMSVAYTPEEDEMTIYTTDWEKSGYIFRYSA